MGNFRKVVLVINIRNVVLVTASLAIGIAVGVLAYQYRTRPPGPSPRPTSRSLAVAAVETVAADPKKGDFILRCAIARMPESPDECSFVWNAIREIESRETLAPAQIAAIKEEFIKALRGCLVSLQSSEDVEKLYALRAQAAASLPVPSTVSPAAEPLGRAGQSFAEPSLSSNPGKIAKLFEEGLATQDSDRAELLTQLAIKSQDSTPALVPLLWKHYGEYLEKQKLTPEECVLRLTTYLESVEKAALTAKNEVEFETVWDVRKSVIGKRNAAVESVKHEIGTDLNKAAQEIRQLAGKADHLAAIKQLSDVGGELLPKIQVIKVVFSSGQAGTDALPKAVTEGVTAAVKEVLVVAEKQVAELEQNRDAEVKADSSGDTPEPGGAADGPSAKKDAPLEERPGRYEALGHRLSELRQAMDDADVPTWLGVLSNSGKETKEHQEKSSKPATSQVTECEKMSANLQKRIESLSGDLSRLQGLRYNLWALRTIYRAESSPNWDGILGRIDVGLLQPTVSSRYSSTYETLIKDKTDPRTRIVAVQNVLNGKKIGLTSF